MIRRLRRRMTAMVISVLVLVSAGIVLAIHTANDRSIAAQAKSTLSVLAENSGSRPSIRRDGSRNRNGSSAQGSASRPGRGSQLPDLRGGEDTAAGLSNSYTITLNEDNSVASWTSDRMDLYSDEQVSAVAESILREGRDSGRIGTQFYRKITESGSTLLIVLDARLDFLSASNVLRSMVFVAAAACLLLSLLAWLLIRRMIRPVEDAFTRQKQFVSDASHELKTPLAVISANAEVLEQEIGENEYLGYIRSEVRRTDSLVRNLLTLARMDRNNAGAEMKRFDMSHAVLDVVLPFESTVFEAGKTLVTDIPDGIDCTGNEEMVKQLAVILLSNALKYSDDGGRIEVTLKAKGRQRELTVFNTGNPISPADQLHIFDRFWRGDPSHSRETGGHGLGLAIARSIVETHRGKITVDSGENKGTAFIGNMRRHVFRHFILWSDGISGKKADPGANSPFGECLVSFSKCFLSHSNKILSLSAR